jgi:hypothetical protein
MVTLPMLHVWIAIKQHKGFSALSLYRWLALRFHQILVWCSKRMSSPTFLWSTLSLTLVAVSMIAHAAILALLHISSFDPLCVTVLDSVGRHFGAKTHGWLPWQCLPESQLRQGPSCLHLFGNLESDLLNQIQTGSQSGRLSHKAVTFFKID